MLKNIYLKSIIYTIVYLIITSIISVLFYYTIGDYILNNIASLLPLTDTVIYSITLFGVYIIAKKQTISHIFIPISTSKTVINILIIILIVFLFRIALDPLYRIDLITGKIDYPNIKDRTIEPIKALIYLINTAILVPIIEELFFRKIIFYNILQSTKDKVYISILLSSTLFAIIHVRFYPFYFNPIYFMNALFTGVVSCFIYLRYGRILYSIFFHSLINLMAFLINNYIAKEYWEGLKILNFNLFYWLLFMSASLILSIFLIQTGLKIKKSI